MINGMASHIRAILFDIGGTLRRTTPSTHADKIKKVGQILDLIGANQPVEEFSQALTERDRAYRLWANRMLLELNERELWTRWMLPDWPADQISIQAIQLNQLWRQATGKRDPLPEAKDVIVELFRRGYRLGVVSNTTSSTETPQLFHKLEISGLFETVVLSCQFGRRKGDPAIMLEAVTRMDIPPECCAYVGDHPARDVVAARGAGISQTVILRDPFDPQKLQLSDPDLMPDHIIDNLKDLLALYPPLLQKKAHNGVEQLPVWEASLSTMWAIQNFTSLGDFFHSAQRMGFARIELNHQIDSAMLAGFDKHHIRFSSIHEPCPADIPVDLLKERDWLISAQDDENRRQGVAAVKRSIDLAHELGVPIIVVHCGNVQTDLTHENRIRSLFESGLSHTSDYQMLIAESVKTRTALAEPCFAAVRQSLAELLEYAGRFDIRLGLENRYHYMDIPVLDEMEQLLDMASPERLGFIYDVGHAQTLDRLGYYPHAEWLKRYSRRMLGTHLHDVVGVHDHQAPGQGEIDFTWLAAYLPGEAFRTVEIHPYNTPQQVKAGLRVLADCGCVQSN
jgi:HAD superfamily hydrolase (TIGR01549 family)